MSTNIQQQNGSSAGPFSGFRARIASGDLGLIPVIIALIVIWIMFQSVNGNFLSGRNLSNLILQIAEIGMLGIGETFVLLLGEIDLSIGAVSGVAAAVLVLLSVAGVNPWICIIASVASGGLIGLFQGFWVTVIGVPAFIVTLAGSLGYQGILLAMLGSTGTVPISNKTLLNLTSTYVTPWLGWVTVIVVVVLYAIGSFLMQKNRENRHLPAQSTGSTLMRSLLLVIVSAVVIGVLNTYRGLPVAGFILLVFVVLFAFITQSTVYGRHIYALGGNKEAARRAGINTRAIKISIFTLAGFMGAIGGIIGASRLGSASPASGGGNLLMDSIAAAVIGGTSLFGGRGSMWNALAGALVIGSVENGMDLLSAPSSTKYIVEGGILLIAVTIDTVTRRRRTQAGR
ncbi:sugar ABC transporter permease [Alicyclobacillus dauci]|uniref:Xylose transport system permease protein XylH n=1 Tax=Alicyclobacillus dauci TaxID=1475485 RepID=A0ABY6Z401_9BACL|nr:ABC transporter permease [Alicyclobacillus dauci]WAH37248.1 ABC transporter permease [Alicyclobacillus dauci]